MERLRAYPWVIATLAVGAVGLALLAAGLDDASRWTVVAWVVLVAATQAWDMVRSLRAGDVGLDILAVLAISAAVAVGEHWAALVVVIMLTGGEALEDYAERRAKRELGDPRCAGRSGDLEVVQPERGVRPACRTHPRPR